MRPGEKNILILKKMMSKFNIEQKLNITTKEDGIFYSIEIDSNQLNFISQSYLNRIPKEIRDKALDRITSLHPSLIENIEIPFKFNETLRYDFVIYKVLNNKVTFLKTFELQGDGHFETIFGVDDFIKTILSDVIKEETGTIMIPFYKGIQKEKILQEIIKKVCA